MNCCILSLLIWVMVAFFWEDDLLVENVTHDVDLPLAVSLLSGHHRFELVKIPVEQIADNDTEFSVCRYGRVHSSLTRCSKRIRPALRVSGESLVMLDIANSQPLFLSLLIINYRTQGNKTFGYVTFSKNSTNQYRGIDKIIEETISSFNSIHDSLTSSSSSSSSIFYCLYP